MVRLVQVLGSYLCGLIRLGFFSRMFWTIGYELQFYLLFPYLIAIFRTRGHSFAVGLIALALIARWIIWVEVGSARDPAYWSLLGLSLILFSDPTRPH